MYSNMEPVLDSKSREGKPLYKPVSLFIDTNQQIQENTIQRLHALYSMLYILNGSRM